MDLMMTSDLVSEGLRAIGEDLEFRGIKTFSIHCNCDLFVVDGGYQQPPAPMPVTLHYAHKDLEELKRKASERGDHLPAKTSFIYLPDILAAIAANVNKKGGELLTLSNAGSTETDRIIEVEYEARHQEHIVERLTRADVYALCIRAHKQRQRERIASSKFTRFSSLPETSAAR